MSSGRTKLAVAFLLLLAVAGFGFSDTQGDSTPEAGVAARLATARDAFKAIDEMREAGQHLDPSKNYLWSRRLMDAERDAAVSKAGRVAAAKAHVDRMNKLMKASRVQLEHAELSRLDYLDIEFHHNEAVSWWEKESTK